jgi:hypothetical protein
MGCEFDVLENGQSANVGDNKTPMSQTLEKALANLILSSSSYSSSPCFRCVPVGDF